MESGKSFLFYIFNFNYYQKILSCTIKNNSKTTLLIKYNLNINNKLLFWL